MKWTNGNFYSSALLVKMNIMDFFVNLRRFDDKWQC